QKQHLTVIIILKFPLNSPNNNNNNNNNNKKYVFFSFFLRIKKQVNYKDILLISPQIRPKSSLIVPDSDVGGTRRRRFGREIHGHTKGSSRLIKSAVYQVRKF